MVSRDVALERKDSTRGRGDTAELPLMVPETPLGSRLSFRSSQFPEPFWRLAVSESYHLLMDSAAPDEANCDARGEWRIEGTTERRWRKRTMVLIVLQLLLVLLAAYGFSRIGENQTAGVYAASLKDLPRSELVKLVKDRIPVDDDLRKQLAQVVLDAGGSVGGSQRAPNPGPWWTNYATVDHIFPAHVWRNLWIVCIASAMSITAMGVAFARQQSIELLYQAVQVVLQNILFISHTTGFTSFLLYELGERLIVFTSPIICVVSKATTSYAIKVLFDAWQAIVPHNNFFGF